METLIREQARSTRLSEGSFSRDLRSLLAGHFAQSVYTFAEGLERFCAGDGAKPYGYILQDALQLYDFLLISALQPQTVRLGKAENVVKKGGRFINLQFHFQQQSNACLELALSDEPRRRKIQGTLLKKMRWRSGRIADFPFIAISATSWSRSPILTEMITGFQVAGERFFPLKPYEYMDNRQFNNYFDELEAFEEYASLLHV